MPDLQEVMKLVAHQRLEKLHLVQKISLTQEQQEKDLLRHKRTQEERIKQLNDLFLSHGDKGSTKTVGALGQPTTPPAAIKFDPELNRIDESGGNSDDSDADI